MKGLKSHSQDFGFFSKENEKLWRLPNQRNDVIGFVFKSISKAIALDSGYQKWKQRDHL